jgi:hypothetical protein
LELFKISDDRAVCCNPGGRFHGWMFVKHADGHYVSERPLETTEPWPPGKGLDALFGSVGAEKISKGFPSQ